MVEIMMAPEEQFGVVAAGRPASFRDYVHGMTRNATSEQAWSSARSKDQMNEHARDRVICAASSWPFLMSVSLLLLNDVYLKPTFSNWLTGKLSDVSGIVLVSLLVFSAFPRAACQSAAGVIVGFAVWKSPLSQPLIDLGRVLGFARFGRVVDYSDLVALAIVPLGYGVANNLHRFQIARARVTRALSGPSLAVALLAVLGTSVASYRESYIIRKTDGLEQFDGMLAARLIADVAKKNDLECVICDRVAEIAEYHGHSISMRYQISDQRSIAFSIMALPPRSFFSNSNSRERRLSHAISEPLSVAT